MSKVFEGLNPGNFWFVLPIQGYRLISGLVARPWCLIEIISRPEIIDIVTDTLTETNKIGLYLSHFLLIPMPLESLIPRFFM